MAAKKTSKRKNPVRKSPKDFKPSKGDLQDAPGRATKILAGLKKAYPGARCALDYKNPLELLIATILSAQCTDVRVNIVTRDLFRKYRTAADYAGAAGEELEADIKSTGFYRNKARSIKAACTEIDQTYGGRVPDSMDKLVNLAGVGRKTANVILGNAYDTPGIVTDTHVIRLSRLMGLSGQTDPIKLEFDLMDIIPKKDWTLFSHMMIAHGRTVCIARKPDCEHCPIQAYCCYGQKNLQK
ncbi:MAG: endonuclease III [Sedimentisphaerales bacterium]|nr:endonuclease III [Sedimentisphaerales bacterium]